MSNRGTRLAYLFAVLNAIIIGFSFLFAKISLEYAKPLDTLTFRFAASFIVLSIPAAFGWIKLSYRGKPIGKALLLATMYPLGFFALQSYGLERATSAEGGILYAFTPIVTMIIAALFLKEKTTWLQKLSIVMSVFGVLFIFIMRGATLDWTNVAGIALLASTSVAFAGYSVLARSLSKHFSPAEITYFMLAVGFFSFLAISLAQHGANGTIGSMLAPLGEWSFNGAIFYLGIVSSLVTSLLANYILGRIEASKMSVFTNVSTLVSMAGGAFFLKEQLTVHHLIGAMIMIAGVMGANMLGSKSAPQLRVNGKPATKSLQ